MITIHCAWCNSFQPEITKAEWQNLDGESTKNGLVGEPLRLYAETKGIGEIVMSSATKDFIRRF